MKNGSKLSPEIFQKVYLLIDENFFERQRATGIDDLIKVIAISKDKLSEHLQVMLKNKQIHEIFSGTGRPTLYIPFGAIKEMMKMEPKPKWISEFVFPQKYEVLKDIEKYKNEIDKFESFERILYSHDKVLEDAISTTLSFLQFHDVVHTDDSQKHDIELDYAGVKFIIEAKGKTGQGDKDDVLQLRGWIDIKLEEGLSADALVGILIINSHRHIDPNKRTQSPITEKARQFLKMNKFKFISSKTIFEIVKQLLEKQISLEEAQKAFLQGDNI